MWGERRLVLAAGAGLALIAASEEPVPPVADVG
jgi:hypothetical protein